MHSKQAIKLYCCSNLKKIWCSFSTKLNFNIGDRQPKHRVTKNTQRASEASAQVIYIYIDYIDDIDVY